MVISRVNISNVIVNVQHGTTKIEQALEKNISITDHEDIELYEKQQNSC